MLFWQWHDCQADRWGDGTWGDRAQGFVESYMHWRGDMLRMHCMGGRVQLQDCSWDWDKVGCRVVVWKGGGLHQRWTVDHRWGWERDAVRFGKSAALLWCCGAALLANCRAGSKLRTLWKTPWLTVAAVEQRQWIMSLAINAVNCSFCSLQGEILHTLQSDLGHLSSTD